MFDFLYLLPIYWFVYIILKKEWREIYFDIEKIVVGRPSYE